MSLQLYAQGKTDKNREELTHLGTTISALLVDQNSRVVCEGSAMPGDGQNERIWVVRNCVNMPLKPSSTYTLTLRITKIDPNTPKIDLLPVLEGGQLELS